MEIKSDFKNLTQFEATIWAQHTLAIEIQMDNYGFGLEDANVKNLKKTTDNVTKSINCDQFGVASSQAGDANATNVIMHLLLQAI